MHIQSWLRDWLGITRIEEKLLALEHRMSGIEDQVSSTLSHFGKYRDRTNEELLLMQTQLQALLDSIKNIIETAENQQYQIRAIKLRGRLLNNLTRIDKQLSLVSVN